MNKRIQRKIIKKEIDSYFKGDPKEPFFLKNLDGKKPGRPGHRLRNNYYGVSIDYLHEVLLKCKVNKSETAKYVFKQVKNKNILAYKCRDIKKLVFTTTIKKRSTTGHTSEKILPVSMKGIIGDDIIKKYTKINESIEAFNKLL